VDGALRLTAGGPFFILMRTIVYIDGLNFYYGCVQDTPYKWLDFKKLVQRLTRGERQILEIKYFTANILGDTFGHNRQKMYLLALEARIPELSICKGWFKRNERTMLNVNPPPERVSVWKYQEKGTDVNIAVNLLNDAWTDSYDCALIMSNDSDLLGAFRMVKRQHPQKHIVLAPTAKSDEDVSKVLTQHAHSVIEITEADLAASQLPDSIPGTKIRKPQEW